jgi:hypothetical protein
MASLNKTGAHTCLNKEAREYIPLGWVEQITEGMGRVLIRGIRREFIRRIDPNYWVEVWLTY